MASRRLLTSVANGTAAAFGSRNNDVDGWWAPGLLLDALDEKADDYRVDLITGTSLPPLEDELHDLGSAWARYFRWSLDRHGIRPDIVREGTLSLSFDRTRRTRSGFPGADEVPFQITVALTDDRGRQYAATVNSSCGRLEDFRDPNPYQRPMRSTSRTGDPGRIGQRLTWRAELAERRLT